VRNTSGYPQNPDDGVRIYSTTSDAVIIGVTDVGTGGSATGASVISIGGASGKTINDTTPISTGASLGKKATVFIDNLGVEISGGSGYAVGDILRVPSSNADIGGKISTTELGVANAFHIYDTGSSTALTTNPSYGVTGQSLKAPKYYYALFASYSTTALTLPSISTPNKATKWKKLGQASSFAVTTNSIKSTKDTLISLLPKFYFNAYGGNYNKDLDDFISLFAFHLDTYLAQSDATFNLTNLVKADDKVLNSFLKQLGATYTDTFSNQQARKLITNLVRAYSYSGSILGLQNYLEAYSGYKVSPTSSSNNLLDYNTSSFAESFGSWYPDPDFTNDYYSNPPYHFTTGETVNQYSSGLMELSDLSSTTIDTFSNYLAPVTYDKNGTVQYAYTLLGCISSTASTSVTVNNTTITNTTVTVTTTGSTSKLKPGSKLLVTYTPSNTSSTGALSVGTVVTSVIDDKTFIINKPPSTPLNGATLAASTNITSKALMVRPTVSNTNISYYAGLRKGYIPYAVSSKLKSTVNATITNTYVVLNDRCANITIGSKITRYDGNYGDPLVGNVVTAVMYDSAGRLNVYFKDSLTFTVNTAIEFSSTGRSLIPSVKPYVAKDGDYVAYDYSAPSAIPDGTKIVKVHDMYLEGAASQSGYMLELSNPITNSISSTKLLYFSKNNISGKPGSADSIPVTPNTPYAFCAQFNANGGNTKATSVALTWFDSSGSVISTSTGTLSAPTNADPVSQTNFKTTWYPTYVTAVSPSTAAYCQPSFTITGADNLSGSTPVFYYVDGAYLAKPLQISRVKLTSNVATIYTVEPHNFKVGNTVAVYIPSNSIYNSSTKVITGVYQNINTGVYSFTYSQTSGTDLPFDYPANAYVASIPMIDVALVGSSNVVRLTRFEDAKTTTFNIKANRVNLCPNPSFETDNTGWSVFPSGTSTTASRSTTNGAKFGSAAYSIAFSSGKDTGVQYSANGAVIPAIQVIPGNSYAASAYLKITSGNSATYRLELRWFNISDVQLDTAVGSDTTVTSDIGWTRLNVTGSAPTGAVYATLILRKTMNATGVVNALLDGVLVEQSQTVNPYFDGSFDGYSWEENRDSMWESTTDLSASHLYLNRVNTQGTIETRLTDMIYYG